MKSLYVTLFCVFLYLNNFASPISDITPVAELGVGEITISWVHSDVHVRFYQLEKLNNENRWIGIKMLKPNGSGDFRISDPRIKEGLNSYRLKIKSLEGQYFYSPVTEIVFENIEFNVMIYPNPANNRVVIDADKSTAKFESKLVDRFGNNVLTTGSKNGSCVMNTSNLLEGMYFLKVEGEGNSFKKALVINHR